MITGAHVLLFSENADGDRAFIRDVLKFPNVDAGGGWLIFRLPPSEVAVHPADGQEGAGKPLRAELYLMCDDVAALIRSLRGQGVECADPSEQAWGVTTAVTLPSGSRLGLYQPMHPTALDAE